MAFFRIETFYNGQWTDNLGHGCNDIDDSLLNEFSSDLEAIDAIDELIAVGFRREDLRVAEID
jgi:hypothetical protein